MNLIPIILTEKEVDFVIEKLSEKLSRYKIKRSYTQKALRLTKIPNLKIDEQTLKKPCSYEEAKIGWANSYEGSVNEAYYCRKMVELAQTEEQIIEAIEWADETIDRRSGVQLGIRKLAEFILQENLE